MPNKTRIQIVVGCLLLSVALSSEVTAQGIENLDLQLEVIINDKPTGVIVGCTQTSDGDIKITRSELEAAGVLPPPNSAHDIVLQTSGLAFVYDKPSQQLRFQLLEGQRKAKVYDVRGASAPIPKATASWGGLFNYVMYASSYGTNLQQWTVQPGAASLAIDARAFSPYGVLTQTGIVGNTLTYDLFSYRNVAGLRLDTTYAYDDQDTQISYRAGDVITAGLEWTRPIRLGGLQVQRNFAIRPDLVTAAMPSVSGSAAVPSTVDVLVNGVKAYSQQVLDGPFKLANIPIASTNGAQVVIRDATGRETRTDVSLYADSRLLAPGVLDISGETGAARRFYAFRSNDYDKSLVASASMRYGMWDWLTLQGHAEAGDGLVNVGAGTMARIGSIGTLSAAASWSRFGAEVGGQIYGGLSIPLPYSFQFQATAQRTISKYNDLASATAIRWRDEAVSMGGHKLYNGLPPALYSGAIFAPQMTNSVSIGGPAPLIGGSINLVYAQSTQDPRDCYASGDFGNASTSRILSASYSRQLPFDATLTLVAFAQMSNISNRGVFAGVTMALGGGVRASANIQPMPDLNTGKTRLAPTGQIYKDIGQDIGSYGWSATAGTNQGSVLAASGAYRSSLGTIKVSGSSYNGQQAASAEFQGALAMTGYSIAAGPRVDDAFAIVRAGAPDVTVMAANQNVGKTNIFGTLLIPNLNAYSQNKIAIDPLTLPIETAFDSTNALVTPRNRSGVLVDFGVRTSAQALDLRLIDSTGKALEVGSLGYAEDTGERFVVGYDGVVHLKTFGAVGKININLGDRDCSATIVRQSLSGAAPGSAFICG